MIFSKLKKREISQLTLEGLAKKFYLNKVTENDPEAKITITEINRSLRKLEDYEKTNPEKLEKSLKESVSKEKGLRFYYQ